MKSRVAAPSQVTINRAKALSRPDAWSQLLELKVDAKQFTTKGRKYILAPLRDNSDEIVVKKAAQMGFTVGFIIKTLHNVIERRWNGLYLLPFKQGARTFVQSRIDPIIMSSSMLDGKFSNVANVLHKQTDDHINLYVRGTNVATDLQSVPVDFEIWDERDKFIETWLGDAMARMDGSTVARLIQLSTPTAPGIGIDNEDGWRVSDQCRWEIPCPHCGRFQVLQWDENVKIGDNYLDCILECSACHKQITDEERWAATDSGRWVPSFLDGRKRGFHISQLNSPTKPLVRLFKQYFDSQADARLLRDFYNLGMGEPYAGKGDKFSEDTLNRCIIRGLHLRSVPTGPIYVGVDQGSYLHCKSSYINRGRRIMFDARIFRSWSKLEDWLRSLHNFNMVIDAHPEKSKAKELAEKFPGKIWLGLEKDQPNQTQMAVYDEKKSQVSIDRTMAFDQYIWDHDRKMYGFPMNVREIGEEMPRKNFNGFYAHHFEMVRVPKELPDGRNVVRWAKTRNPDHWHHAGMFELIATLRKPKLAVPIGLVRAMNDGRGGLMQGA
jgi:hypothetical protein